MKRILKRSSIFRQIREQKGLFVVYLVLRIFVVGMMVAQILNQNWDAVFMCVLTLVLFLIPSFIEKRIKIDVPNTLEIIILLFIFAAEILGEIQEYYITYPYWDLILHTINGFVCGAIGFSMIDILNKSEKFAISLSPLFTVMVAICFSMTIGVLWEFAEFGADQFLKTDMQKDTIITSITSIQFNPDGKNKALTIPIEDIVVNGVQWDYGGYIDIGLIDTMEDLFVNFVGALIFSVIGMLNVKHGKGGKFMDRFILTRKLPHDGEGST